MAVTNQDAHHGLHIGHELGAGPAGPTRRHITVATIGSRGLPGQRAGVERVLEAVCPRLVGTECVTMRVYCPTWLDYDGDQYRGVQLPRISGFRTKYGETITRSLKATLRELRSDADIVHYHSVGSAPLSILPRLCGKRVIVTVHAIDSERSKWSGLGKLYLRFAEWTSVRFPHLTVAVSPAVREALVDRWGGDVACIPNGAERPERRPLVRMAEFGLEPGKYVLFVGRLVPEKGVHLLIEAFCRLPQDLDLKLAIVGPAWYEARYRAELAELAGGDERIVFTGEADDDMLRECYSNCALYVLPSDVEGMSLSLLDAMAHGVPIVTSSIRPNADLVGDAGVVFPAGDVDALHRAMIEVLSDPRRAARLGEAGRARAVAEFDWDEIAQQWLNVYERVLA